MMDDPPPSGPSRADSLRLREAVASHQYLGDIEDLRNVGSHDLSGGNVVTLPVLFTTGAVLFPGHTLPLKLFALEEKRAVDKALASALPSQRNLVFICSRGSVPMSAERRLPRGVPRLPYNFLVTYRLGAVVEIRKIGVGPEGEYNLMATGRYRASLVRRFDASVEAAGQADVEILPEYPPLPLPSYLRTFSSSSSAPSAPSPSPTAAMELLKYLPSTNPDALRRLGSLPSLASPSSPSYDALPNGAPRYIHYTHTPAWAYRGYDWRPLARRVVSLALTLSSDCFGLAPSLASPLPTPYPTESDADLSNECDHARLQHLMAQDPLRYGYELAAALPMDFVNAKRLHDAQTVVDRLRLTLEVLGSLSSLSCASCSRILGDARKALALGPKAAGLFVNPHGYSHDIICLGEMVGRRLELHGRPSTADTWFPGYAWTIISCSCCGSHLGWKYTAVPDKAGRAPSPPAFYGVRREAVQLGSSGVRTDSDEDEGGDGRDSGEGMLSHSTDYEDGTVGSASDSSGEEEGWEGEEMDTGEGDGREGEGREAPGVRAEGPEGTVELVQLALPGPSPSPTLQERAAMQVRQRMALLFASLLSAGSGGPRGGGGTGQVERGGEGAVGGSGSGSGGGADVDSMGEGDRPG